MSDLRYAVRGLLARPGFSLVAILTLALGIGANTAIFTVVNAVLLRPLPFRDPGKLVLVVERNGPFPTTQTTSWQNYVGWRDQSRSFENFGAFRNLTMTLSGGTEPERVPAKMLSAAVLPALGVAPTLGRGFTPEDDAAGAQGVVILSESLWRRRFAGAADAIGRAVTLDNQPYIVIGVMPPHFQLLQQADVFVPMGPWAATLPDDRGWHPGIWPLARLGTSTSLEQARAEMKVISDRLEKDYPTFNRNLSAEVRPLQEYAVQNVRQSLLVLVAAVGFVLLVACANVANLLLARAVGRQKEMAIRTAVGASRARIVGQLLTESVVLSVAGGAAGLILATWSVPMLARLAGSNAPAVGTIVIDQTALAFTVAVSFVTGFLFGLIPALQTTRIDVAAAINESGRGTAAGVGHHRLRGLLVIVEMTLATVLLVGAALLTKSLIRLQDVSPGFNPDGLLVADAPLSPVSYASQAQRNQLVERLVPKLKEIPGVKIASVATAPPFSGTGSTIHFNIVGRPPKGPEDYIATGYRAIGPDYFLALGVPVIAGRTFTDRDRDRSRPVAIVNETFVRRFLGGDTGLTLRSRAQLGTVPDDEAETPIMDIVGIVGDTRQAFETATDPTMFVPYLQHPIDVIGGLYRGLSLVLKTDGDAASLAPSLRAAVREIDREQPLARVRTMQEAMNESVAQPRLRTTLLTLFSAVALALSLIGVYGVMAYAVSERTHEIGVRLALGASPSDIRSLVVGQGLKLAAVGIAIGIAGALLTSRGLTALLFGVSPNDPVTFAASALALALAAVAAVYGPARRASRIDPVVMLR
ncbi:MAG TPA: ABC transporter permease [Vicinamibacterales bacterium]|jgi:putative ABC transport system permease protein